MSSPSLAEFQFEIGARISRGDLPGVAVAAAGCRAAWPQDPAGWLLGSIAALLAEQKEAALTLVEARLAVDPRDLQCLLQRAECLLALGRREAALAAAGTAAAQAGEDPAALDAVGEFLVFAAAHGRALAIYDRAVAAAPRDATILSKRAVLHRYLGDFGSAERDFTAVLAIAPTDSDALMQLTELRRQSAERNSIPSMEAALAAAAGGSKDAATLHFALAKAYDDIGDYARGWTHLTSGNELERAGFHYESATDRGVVEHIIAAFPAVEPVRSDTTGERPIFIVGLPRTGTTLMERVIGNHSQVHCAGELAALSEAIGAAVATGAAGPAAGWLAYADAFGGLDGTAIASEYLARARVRRGDRPRFTDKQTTNFYYCALIFRAFPEARVVHLTRHPLAACYAIYKTHFRGTFPFAYDLSELGEFYAGYRRLMAHWHQVLPGRILDVAYEDVVTDQEATTRRVLEYLDLPFEDACLEFHNNPAPSTTASSVQVRQPLYDTSLNHWRHYAEQLAPLRAQLEAAGIPVE